MIDPHDAKLRIDIGEVQSGSGRLRFGLEIQGTGRGHLGIYADDPNNSRKSGVFVFLNLDGYNQLRRIIRKTDETIKELYQQNKLTQLALPWE
ncbi:MAG: hypothetical protein KGL39_16375 [Patescibacteria group bacterium]|nr:hypothetical protein [Patescibacteria group bacterium]